MRANSFRGRSYTGHIAFRGIEVLVKTNPPFSLLEIRAILAAL